MKWNKAGVRSKLYGCMKISGCLCLLFLFFSCASKPGFEGYGDLCGMIIDENNRPVKNFIVYYSKEPAIHKSTATNESGIFVFHRVPSGKAVISGEKKNYTKLEKTEYQFYRRSDIICFQIMSLKKSVDEIEALAERGEIQAALELLEQISCEKKTDEWKLLSAYRKILEELNE